MVLITGADGFIGQHLVRRLSGETARVRALVGSRDGARFAPNVEVIEGDVRDSELLERAVEGCSLVFHLAAKRSSAAPGARDLFATNVEASADLARAAARAGVERMVFTSATAVYGLTRNRHIDESTPLRARSAYGRSKIEAEGQLGQMSLRGDLPLVVARLTDTFGPGATAWYPLFQSIEERRFRLIGSGRGHRQPAAVEDVVDGLLRCATTAGIEGRTYILPGREALALRQMLDLIAAELGVPIEGSRLPEAALVAYRSLGLVARGLGLERLPRFDRVELFLNDRAFDMTRARDELGYRPQSSCEAAIAATVASFQSAREPQR